MPSVQYVRWAKFRVMVTCFVALAILGLLVALLTGGTLFKPRSVIYVYLPDATGLGAGSPVRVDGVQVGKVESVALSGSIDPNRIVKVTMEVERDGLSSITEDSGAQPAADTLVGDKFIQISTGKSQKRLQPGSEISFKGSADLVKSLDLSDFSKKLALMDSMLTDIEQGKSQVGEFVMGNALYNDIQSRLSDLLRAIRAASNTTSVVGRELYTDALSRQISEPLIKLDDTLARLQSGQGTAGRLLRDNTQYEELRKQVAELRKTAGDVRGSEMMRSAAMYDGMDRGVAGWIQKVDAFNATPWVETTATYEQLNGMAKELQGSVKEFRADPRKFLRIDLF